MIKLFERIFWHNNTTPALNETNLNLMSKAIDDIDNRVIELGSEVLEVVPQIQTYLAQAEDLVNAMETLTTHPPYIGENGDWYVWSTEDMTYVDSEIDASITVDIEDVNMIDYGLQPYITNTGTDTDPVFHLYIPRAAVISSITKTGTVALVDTYTITTQDGKTFPFTVTNGANGANGRGIVSITKTGTAGLVDTYTILYTDNTTSTFTVTNGQNGSGSGDMTKAVYDSDDAVANAGGIKAFIQSLGYITGLAWSALTNKPFSTIGQGLTVVNDALTANIKSVTVDNTGTASASAVSYQRIGVNGIYTEITGTKYMEQTITTSTSGDVTATFTNAEIRATSRIDDWYDVYGMAASNIVTTDGQCVVTIPKQSSAFALGVRIYIS